ncbi:MAG: hypothetical protein OXC71_08335 [Chloroflexi bacterium]|nr:hypothetical protein [Chloroflexota bacterium]
MTAISQRAKTLIIAFLVGVIALGAGIAVAHNDGTEIRITAMRHDDGRIEFAVQERDGEGWGERILPRARFFPASGREGRWLNSTPITVGVVESLESAAVTVTPTATSIPAVTPTAAPTSSAPTEVESTQYFYSWGGGFYGTERDPIDDTLTTFLAKRASESTSYNSAYLYVRCDAGKLSAFVNGDRVPVSGLDDTYQVVYRVDDRPAVSQTWREGGWEIAVPPDESSFYNDIQNGDKVVVRLTGYRTTETLIFRFDLGSIDDESHFFDTAVQWNIDNCGSY